MYIVICNRLSLVLLRIFIFSIFQFVSDSLLLLYRKTFLLFNYSKFGHNSIAFICYHLYNPTSIIYVFALLYSYVFFMCVCVCGCAVVINFREHAEREWGCVVTFREAFEGRGVGQCVCIWQQVARSQTS